MSEEEIALTRPTEAPPRSLALMLKNQYVSKDLNDVFASTELREHEIVGTCGIFSTRFVSWVMSTTEKDLEGLKGEQKKNVEERLAIKRRIMNDPNAMAFSLQDSYLYAFGLLRQSLKRQSRKEAMNIAMSPRPVSLAEDVGMKDKLFSKLGVSRKYKTLYAEK